MCSFKIRFVFVSALAESAAIKFRKLAKYAMFVALDELARA